MKLGAHTIMFGVPLAAITAAALATGIATANFLINHVTDTEPLPQPDVARIACVDAQTRALIASAKPLVDLQACR